MDFGDNGLYDFDIDISAFDFDFTVHGTESERYSRPTIGKAETVSYSNAEQMARAIKMEHGFRMFSFVSGNFIFGDLLEALSAQGKWQVEKLTIQTLSMSQNNIDSLENLIIMDNPSELRFILSDYWYAHERGVNGLVGELYRKLDIGDGFRCAYCRTHSKVATVLTKAGNKVVIHGSANLRSSDNIEQVCIENDPDLYDFCDAFADGILDTYDVVNRNVKKHKSLGSGETWQAGAAAAAEEARRAALAHHRESQTQEE